MPYRINEDGDREKYCHQCKEWWPATREFFYSGGHTPGDLASQCRACYLEKKYAKRYAARVMICRSCGLWQHDNQYHACYKCDGRLCRRFDKDGKPVELELIKL